MTLLIQSAEGRSIDELLRALVEIESRDARNQGLREKLLSLEKKLASNQLHLAVLGQMKRGKSSFINALLGAEILPTGVLPVTSVITKIKYGPAPDATVLFTTGQESKTSLSTLANYITEVSNPGNRKQVASVEISYPSPFLKCGIILIDTPGIGSTHSHNTRTTRGYLEHVDAGIVVLSVDPPITEAESLFIKDIKGDIPKLFFILNKIDSASADEASHLMIFLANELDRLQMGSPEIFLLSAREAIRWKKSGAGTADSSGIDNFERRLQTFLSDEKSSVLVSSIALDVLSIARSLKFSRAIGIRALAMSRDELDCKRQALDRLLERTDTEIAELNVLLRQHSAEIVGSVEHNLAEHVEAAVPKVQRHLQLFQTQHPKVTGRRLGTLLEDFLMQEVESVFRSWRVREDEDIQSRLNTLSARFVDQANAILERLQQTAGSLFGIPAEPVSIACPLSVESRLYYKVERVFYSLDSLLLVLPGFLLRPLVLKKMHGRTWQLLDMNAGRIRYDYVERLQATISRFSKELNAAITIVSEDIRLSLHKPNDGALHESAVLESVIRDCSLLVAQAAQANDVLREIRHSP